MALSVPAASADQKFLLSVAGGDPPDCMAQWNQVIPAWADNGLLVPLDSLMSPDEWADMQSTAYPVALKIGTYKGHLYGVTTGINIWACYYNPQHLIDAGLDPDAFPTDLDTLWSWGLKLTQHDETGHIKRLGFMPQRLTMYTPIFNGRFWDEKTGRVYLNTPENLQALQYLADRRAHYGFDNIVRFESSLNNSGGSLEWPFISGQYSITVDGQWRVQQLAQYASEMNYRTAPVPPPPGGKTHAGWSNGNFMIIPKGAKQVDGAWAFIKFWSGLDQPHRAAEFYTWGGWLPISPRVAEAPIYQAYLQATPQFKTFLDILPSENIQSTPQVPYQVYLWDMIQRADDLAVRGEKTPKEALIDLEQQVENELLRRERFGLP
jgi:multiple sugar transport system substrate-binding protein